MGAVTVGAVGTNQKMSALCAGPQNTGGATIKTVLITLPSSYDAGGSTLSFATLFADRIYWAVPTTPFFINASTGGVTVGLVPGAAKSDGNGYAVTGWKVRAFATATESSGDLSAYTGYVTVCGV